MLRRKLTFTFFKHIHLKKTKTETKLSKPKDTIFMGKDHRTEEQSWPQERPQNWEILALNIVELKYLDAFT